MALTHTRCELLDFDLKKNPKGAKPVVDWIIKYFSKSPSLSQVKTSINDVLRGASPVTSTDRMPIILQHSGHSRMIVGYEVSGKGAINLLTFDPGAVPKKSLRKAGLAQFASSISASQSKTESAESSKPSSSSSNILQYIRHPVHPNKRRASDSMSSPRGGSNKRQRSCDDENEVVIIEDPTPTPSPSSKGKQNERDELNPLDVVNWFRLDTGTLRYVPSIRLAWYAGGADDNQFAAGRKRTRFCIFPLRNL